jgi:hypothetical protein
MFACCRAALQNVWKEERRGRSQLLVVWERKFPQQKLSAIVDLQLSSFV